MASSARVSKRPKTEQAAVTAEQAANAEILGDVLREQQAERQAWRTSLLEQKTQISELQTELKQAKEELKAAKEEAKEEEAQADTATKQRKKHFRKWISDLQERCDYQDGKIKELRQAASRRDELLDDALYFEHQLRTIFFEVTKELKDLAASTMDVASADSIHALHASIHALHAKTSRIRDDKTVCRDLPKSVI
jgi:hypothetical protein